jgi:hypothetical protein
MVNIIKNQKGIALVLATILLLVLSVLAVAMVFLGRHETLFMVKGRLSDSALYIADGGVEYAINELRKDSNYRGPTTYTLGNAGQFTVNVSVDGQPEDHYEITSTGFVPDATHPRETRRVKSVVNLTQEVSSVFQHAIASQGNITLQGNAVINSDNPQGEGDIYSGGNILLQNNATVNGDASAVGTITTQGNSTITGERNPGGEPLDFPEIDTARYISEAQAGGTYNGNYIVGSNQNLGPLYITGNLVIQGNYQVTLTGTVYVAGSVTLQGTPDTYSFTGSETLVANGNVTMQGDATSGIPLVISVHGNVTLQGNISTQGTVIYAPEGNVTIQGNPDVNGVVVGQTVTIQGSASVTRQVDLTGYPLPGGGISTASVVSWQEL